MLISLISAPLTRVPHPTQPGRMHKAEV